jgi:SAM-dependent methyltransferase
MSAPTRAAVDRARLDALYAAGDDPWGFRTSEYEQAKFARTRAALTRDRYASALEIGCGNGELARHLAPACDRYTGLDAVETALAAARRAVPEGRFVQGFLPCPLPDGPHDLIVVSEVLYFLDRPGLAALAGEIAGRWPRAEVLAVTWLGPSGNALEGGEALAAFAAALAPGFRALPVARQARYRIDRFVAPEFASPRGAASGGRS